MAGGLAQAIGLGYGGNPQRTDGTDRFREEFARGQAIQANRAAAKANADAEKRKSIEAVMKDMAVTTDMTPFFQREFTRRQAEKIAALNDLYMNPGANSVVAAANILREFKDDLGYYTNASKNERADLAKIEDAKKNGSDFFVSNNPITVGDSKYNHIYDALNQSQLADTEEGLSEIVKQGTVPGEWSYGRDNKGRSVINSTLNLTAVDPVALSDKYVKPEDYSVYGESPRQVVKGPFGEQRHVYDVMIAPDRAGVISKEVSTNPNVVKYYGLEEWKRRKAENPSLTFQEFASDQEVMESIATSVPTNVKAILQAKRRNETLDGHPRVESSGSNPLKGLSVNVGSVDGGKIKTFTIAGKGVNPSNRTFTAPEDAIVYDELSGQYVTFKTYGDRLRPGRQFTPKQLSGRPDGLAFNSVTNTFYAAYSIPTESRDPALAGNVKSIMVPIKKGGDSYSSIASAYGLSTDAFAKLLNDQAKVDLGSGRGEVDWMHQMSASGVPPIADRKTTTSASKEKDAASGGSGVSSQPKTSGIKKWNPETGKVE